MMTLLAAIEGGAVIQAIILLVCLGLVFWLLYWLVDYVAMPEPFNKVARVILAIAAVIVLINCIMSLAGKPFIQW